MGGVGSLRKLGGGGAGVRSPPAAASSPRGRGGSPPSRMLWVSVSSITSRSMPMPSPPWAAGRTPGPGGSRRRPPWPRRRPPPWPAAWASKRRRCSSGSISSEKALPARGRPRSPRTARPCRAARGGPRQRRDLLGVVDHEHRAPQLRPRWSSRRSRGRACPGPTRPRPRRRARWRCRRSSSIGMRTSTRTPACSSTRSVSVARRHGGVRSSSRPP